MTGGDPGVWSVLIPLACYTLAVASALVAARWEAVRLVPSLLTGLGGVAGVTVALTALRAGTETRFDGWAIAPFAPLTLRLDALAAFFLLVISALGVATAVYGVGYLDAPHAAPDSADHAVPGHPPRAALDGLLAAFLAAMIVVILADGIVPFLLAWELMSLLSFFLVIGDGRHRDRRRAGFIYVIMTHVGAGFLLLALLLAARHAGSLEFAAIRQAAPTLAGWERDSLFLLAVLGFGTKAGLIPLHIWLPRAHPAAPSHVSALMSGVMVKIGLYGLIRVIWELAGPGPAWWGGLLIVAGGVSAVLGILYALMERDLKRVLAYSTVEHVGIITLGLGAAAMLTAGGHREAAALALVAALVHLLNHAFFKGLLFFGAGAVQVGTGTRDLERLGGLIRRMPRTAILFLIGASAIAALPPLNGFVGEWLLIQTLLRLGSAAVSAPVATLAAIGAATLALTAALGLACFVRAFGIGFLAQPRTPASRDAREVALSLQSGMALLAAGCILLGLAPSLVFGLLRPITAGLVGVTGTPAIGSIGLFDGVQPNGAYAPIALVGGLIGLGIVPWLVARLVGGPGRTRIAPTWVCGVALEPRMQYSATGFAKPLRLIFKVVIRPRRIVMLDQPISPYFVRAVRYEEDIHPIYEHPYTRLVDALLAASHRIRRLQSGSLRAYLTYLFVTLVVVLILAR